MVKSNSGMTLQEVMIAAVILAILSPIVHQTYQFSMRVQKRRAVQEEVLIFASDYLEYHKLLLLNPPEEIIPFDTARIFRSDTLLLERKTIDEELHGFLTEEFSVVVDSAAMVTISHSVLAKGEDSLW